MSLATCALLLLAAGPTQASTVQTSERTPAGSESTERVHLHQHPTLLSMLRQNNRLRRRMGLRPQRINPLLTKAAQNHAWFMARTGSFSHYSNRGPSGRARRFGFGGNVRENIALGQGSVLSAFRSWRNSSGHWASIISDAPEVGFGYARSTGGSPYWVAVYGYPTEEDHKKVAATTAEMQTETKSASNTSQQAKQAAPEINSDSGESSEGDSAKNQPERDEPQTSRTTTTTVQQSTSRGSNYYYPSRRRGIFRRLFR